MKRVKPFRLNRRSFIKGLGVSACLPYMECMADTNQTGIRTSPPKRMAYIYVPNGVGLPDEHSEYKDWHWFPTNEGNNYKFTKVLASLEKHRSDITIIGGLSHPKSRKLLGHIAGDTFLTGGDLRGEYKNSISVDQFAATVKKSATRFPSLVLSADGGVGFKSRASTLSFDSRGSAIPSEHSHRKIFERYFTQNGKGVSDERRKSLERRKKVVDLLLEDSKRLQIKLGQQDKYRLDEHMSALNSIEEQIQRNEAWLDIPLKNFTADHLDMAVDAKIDPQAYIRTMYDLIVLAFKVDLTEVVSYMIAREDGMGFGDNYPRLALGLKKGHHGISHDKSTGHWLEWGQYDQWLASHFSYFISQMKNTTDEFGSLLDNTQILYGSACSTTHNARNYPLILAGGKNMAIQHGNYYRFTDELPLANLFVHMLNNAGVPAAHFADSVDVNDNSYIGDLANIFGHKSATLSL
ncbi:DUF1552 domain-containing protein [Agaribacter marinus]|uniref:DUF1552 domain-containing protein n=1 Tax=Agaribacter marinus TaxID=1431249 RepID=A0AA37WH53_9ALTE|nr:DUF1552 domain-containing protein [Agaribacter marinus]GLR69603.1 hypothetical protein GCM10007852_05110 [Agaribacter marinus]